MDTAPTVLSRQERVFLSVSNYIFTAIFVAEMMVKVPQGPGTAPQSQAPILPSSPPVACQLPRSPRPEPEVSAIGPPQVVALGLLSGEHAYLQSSWNLLDGLLVLVSLVDIVVAMASAGGAKILGVLRVLRLLRTLRPLRWGPGAPLDSWGNLEAQSPDASIHHCSRSPGLFTGCPVSPTLGPLPSCASAWQLLTWMTAVYPSLSSRVISRAPGLKLVVETLISSLRPIGNIVLICCAFFIIFGILGVQVCGPHVPQGLSSQCGSQQCCCGTGRDSSGLTRAPGGSVWGGAQAGPSVVTAAPVSSSKESSTTARAATPGTSPPRRSAGPPATAG